MELLFARNINGTDATGLVYIDNEKPNILCYCDEDQAKKIQCSFMKSEKWDKLDKKIGEYYKEEDDEDFDDHEGSLLEIGEDAAIAFGYL